MSVEDNKALLQRAVEVLWNERDVDKWFTFTTDEITLHFGNVDYRGPAEVREFFEKLQAAFTDSRVNVEDIWGEGDRMAMRWRLEMTQTGRLETIDPLGTRVSIWALEAARFVEGKLAELWLGLDRMATMEQLGVLPTDGSEPPKPIQWVLMKQRRKRLAGRELSA
jgi:predicted ester cyclase